VDSLMGQDKRRSRQAATARQPGSQAASQPARNRAGHAKAAMTNRVQQSTILESRPSLFGLRCWTQLYTDTHALVLIANIFGVLAGRGFCKLGLLLRVSCHVHLLLACATCWGRQPPCRCLAVAVSEARGSQAATAHAEALPQQGGGEAPAAHERPQGHDQPKAGCTAYNSAAVCTI